MLFGIDLMGGDLAPANPLQGALYYLQHKPNSAKIVGFGPGRFLLENHEELINKLSQTGRFELIDTPDVVGMSESPTRAYATKKNSSLFTGFRYLKEEQIDVFIGAGNTGAMMVGSVQMIRTIPGILRPTISSFLPKTNFKTGIILDVGFNPDCRPDVLYQFGVLGSIYLKTLYNIESPRVALLNIGSEKEKGNLVTTSAYDLFESSQLINFMGNIEGYDILNDKADVIVCDGFIGNIVLKTIEGFYKIITQKGYSDEYLDSFNYERYGGVPVLGITRPVIIGHGISSPTAFENMFLLAENILQNNLIQKISEVLKNLNGY